jgi:RNA polymerase sigma factor (sigma-70 family)
VTSESFEALLSLLGPDQETASRAYHLQHARLVRLFAWNNASDPYALADQAFDRLARHAAERPDDPIRTASSFLRGIARNLLREEARRIAQAAEAARTLAAMYPTNRETDDALNDALSACLDRLPPDKRSLLESYYSHSGIDKIQQHARTAKQMGITLNALRNRVMRLRSELETCMRKHM